MSVDFFDSVRVGDAREREGVVYSSRVVQERFTQGGSYRYIAKGMSFAREQRFDLVRERFAHWWQPNLVVSAAFVECYHAVSWFLLICFSSFLEPVCCSASFAVLSILIDRP
jgi:hypothetical protein